jgi:hypothetical protein
MYVATEGRLLHPGAAGEPMKACRELPFDGPDGHDEREEGVVRVELVRGELLGRHAGEEGDAGQHVAMRTNGDVLGAERLAEQLLTCRTSEAPVVGRHVRGECQAADGRDGGQQDSARPQRAACMAEGSLDLVYQLQRLRENEAVESAVRKPVSDREIRNDRCLRVARVDIEDIGPLDSSTKSPAVARVLYFENPAHDVRSVPCQEAFDVVAVNRSAAVISEVCAQRSRASERPEASRAKQTPDAPAETTGGFPQTIYVHGVMAVWPMLAGCR